MCNLTIGLDGVPKNFAEDNESVCKALDITAHHVVEYMSAKGLTLSAAESCTGGMLSAAVTSVSGASAVYLGGVCSYTEEVKQKVLGVKEETLREFTVYSAEVASQMSEGVMRLMGSSASVGITGIAGPSGGTEERPVGTVFVSVRYGQREAVRDLRLYEEYEKPDRDLVRKVTVLKALQMLEALVVESEVR